VKWEWECGGRATIAMFWNVGSMLDILLVMMMVRHVWLDML
jgi:hypothetical protein